jgi:uncharacterized paraquat-inducible protein A
MYATRNNIIKKVPTGFSFTTLFFGIFVMISRGMWPQAVITFLTLGFANWYYVFTLNGIYAEKLASEGWVFK